MKDYTKYIDRIINDAIGADRIKGANFALIKDGRELYSAQYGFADAEREIVMKRDAVFRMFSMTKPVTAVAAMILMERGQLDLKDEVWWYLDKFKNQKVCVPDGRGGFGYEPVKRNVTVADLLKMTSGIPYPGVESPAHVEVDLKLKKWMEKLNGCDKPATVDFMNDLGSCCLAFQPGTHWMYGFSADVLGAVIEVVSGMNLGEFMRREIFEPLGMKETGFAPTGDMRKRMTQAYDDDYGQSRIHVFSGTNLGLGDYPDVPRFESGGAGLLSTIDDYSRFAMMLANGGSLGDVRIISEGTLKLMRTGQLPDAAKADLNWDSLLGTDYGFLVRVLENQAAQGTNATVGEFGWDGWMGTYFTVDPVNKATMLFFVQKAGAGFTGDTRRLRNIVYSMI